MKVSPHRSMEEEKGKGSRATSQGGKPRSSYLGAPFRAAYRGVKMTSKIA